MTFLMQDLMPLKRINYFCWEEKRNAASFTKNFYPKIYGYWKLGIFDSEF